MCSDGRYVIDEKFMAFGPAGGSPVLPFESGKNVLLPLPVDRPDAYELEVQVLDCETANTNIFIGGDGTPTAANIPVQNVLATFRVKTTDPFPSVPFRMLTRGAKRLFIGVGDATTITPLLVRLWGKKA